MFPEATSLFLHPCAEALDLMTFPDSGNFNGVVFITFKSQKGYDAAMAYNGEELEGRTVRVGHWLP